MRTSYQRSWFDHTSRFLMSVNNNGIDLRGYISGCVFRFVDFESDSEQNRRVSFTA